MRNTRLPFAPRKHKLAFFYTVVRVTFWVCLKAVPVYHTTQISRTSETKGNNSVLINEEFHLLIIAMEDFDTPSKYLL